MADTETMLAAQLVDIGKPLQIYEMPIPKVEEDGLLVSGEAK